MESIENAMPSGQEVLADVTVANYEDKVRHFVGEVVADWKRNPPEQRLMGKSGAVSTGDQLIFKYDNDALVPTLDDLLKKMEGVPQYSDVEFGRRVAAGKKTYTVTMIHKHSRRPVSMQ